MQNPSEAIRACLFFCCLFFLLRKSVFSFSTPYVFFAETDLLGRPVMDRPALHSHLSFQNYSFPLPILNLNHHGVLLHGVKDSTGTILNVMIH